MGVGAFDDGVGEGGEGEEDERLANRVEAAGARCFGFGDEFVGEEDGDEADGEVDPEDGAPADGLGEGSSDERADGEGDAGDGSPDADGAGSCLGVGKDVGDDGEGDGVEHGSAEALDGSKGDELVDGVGERAEKRPEAEGRQADEEAAAAAEAVGHGAGEHEEGGDDEGVGVEDPLQAGELGVEIVLDGGEGDVDDGDVHPDEQEGAAADGEDGVGMDGGVGGWHGRGSVGGCRS